MVRRSTGPMPFGAFMHRLAGAIVLAAGLAACAHAPEPATAPPDYAPIVGDSAPPNARLYADCIGQAVASGTYDRVHDPDTELIRFTCTGAPARAFYDGLAARSAAVGSEFSSGGLTYRSTERINRNLFGLDFCATDAADHARCEINLNAGTFLQP